MASPEMQVVQAAWKQSWKDHQRGKPEKAGGSAAMLEVRCRHPDSDAAAPPEAALLWAD